MGVIKVAPQSLEQFIQMVKSGSTGRAITNPWGGDVILDLTQVTVDNLEDYLTVVTIHDIDGERRQLSLIPEVMSNSFSFSIDLLAKTRIGDGEFGEFAVIDLLGKKWQVIRSWRMIKNDMRNRIALYTLIEE